MVQSEFTGEPADRAAMYARLWAGSTAKPYDEEREASVASRRFASVAPAIQVHADRIGGPLRILDFGCADGHTAELILRLVTGHPIDYFGCDLYPLDATAERMSKAGYTAATSERGLAGMPDDWRDFDVVLALSCFQYIRDSATTMAGLVRRIAPGGLFIGYFYDAPALRQATDEFLRGQYDTVGRAPEELLAQLAPLAALNCALRDALGDTFIDVPEDVPELGISRGRVRLQQLLIDNILFAWAPGGATRTRVQWALGEMLLTGPQVYLSAVEVHALLTENRLVIDSLETGPSGHLVIAHRA